MEESPRIKSLCRIGYCAILLDSAVYIFLLILIYCGGFDSALPALQVWDFWCAVLPLPWYLRLWYEARKRQRLIGDILVVDILAVIMILQLIAKLRDPNIPDIF